MLKQRPLQGRTSGTANRPMGMRQILLSGLTLACAVAPLHGQNGTLIPIESGERLEAINTVVTPVSYKGRKAVQVVEGPQSARALGEAIAQVPGLTFREGTIEVDVAGAPGRHAAPDDRGFIGIAFHIEPNGQRLKTFYLRPTNGRAEDQLRRNHSTQYTADPDWPWHRLRKEQPGVYESYVDVVAGEWTRIRIEVSGTRATFYVNDSPQPVLVVTDLKYPVIDGGVALWVGSGTEGYFSNLKVTRKPGG